MQDDRESIIHELSEKIAQATAARLVQLLKSENLILPSNVVEPINRLIFINYRHIDSEDICGRFYERLVLVFGKDNVFRDVYDILPGYNFKVELERQIAKCDVMLVLMGREWFTEENRLRLYEDEDYVRIEIETALKRGIPVIPVWVARRNSMPAPTHLPPGIRDLVDRIALPIRPDPYFDADINHLVARMQDIFRLIDEPKQES